MAPAMTKLLMVLLPSVPTPGVGSVWTLDAMG